MAKAKYLKAFDVGSKSFFEEAKVEDQMFLSLKANSNIDGVVRKLLKKSVSVFTDEGLVH